MPNNRSWIYDILLVAALLLAAYLRLTGVAWGEGQHQHPDELFITGVTEGIRAHACKIPDVSIDACPPDQQRWMTPAEFLSTSKSTLNPNNRGAGFYVYGNLPIILVRVAYEIVGPELAGPMKYFGRQFAAFADLFAIFILYFIVARLYDKKTALLAALFSSLAVMQIQQSHFYTVDAFTTPFMLAALYFAAKIAYGESTQVDAYTGTHVDTYTGTQVDAEQAMGEEVPNSQLLTPNSHSSFILQPSSLIRDPLVIHSLLFGLFLGMAAACKINAVVLAIALPGAFAIRFWDRLVGKQVDTDTSTQVDTYTRTQVANASAPDGLPPATRHPSLITDYWKLITVCLVIGGLATLLAFRLFQPYAFDGLLPNPQWLKSMSEIRSQATGAADLPWNLQWIRRSHLYSFENLTIWGLGLPLGILAWAGFLVMGWRILKGERRHILLWVWTAIYFGWQSMQFNATMRYQLPIYPMLCMMAAWLAVNAYTRRQVDTYTARLSPISYLLSLFSLVVLLLTAAWAFAFLGIYTRPETRMAASRWIYQNVPGPVTLKYADGTSQPLSLPPSTSILPGFPYLATFTAASDSTLSGLLLPHVSAAPQPLDAAGVNPFGPQTLTLSLLDRPDATSGQELASASSNIDFATLTDIRGLSVALTFNRPIPVMRGQTYYLRIETTGAVTLAGATV
ncbi:MAG: glycosyltransferase family 39 protein, partial [Chloroflexota bacterium]